MIYFVSRHPGAWDWAGEENLHVNQVLEHLDLKILEPGDTVIGSLPIHLAHQVCAKGCSYKHLSLDMSRSQRGGELTAEQMRECGAELTEYRIERV